jgi:hypothetical protein
MWCGLTGIGAAGGGEGKVRVAGGVHGPRRRRAACGVN